MNTNFKYSFSDEPLYKFLYDENEKRIEMCFENYYDGEKMVNEKCVFIIKNWKDSKGKILDADTAYENLQKHIGIPDLILGIDLEEKYLTLHICTKDYKFVSMRFTEAEWEVKKLS